MPADLRYALRGFLKTPGLIAIVLVTLAVGIGANTAIFSVVHAVLLSPTPVRDPSRVALVWETDRNTGTTREPASFPDFRDFQRRAGSFESLGALMAGEMNLTPAQGEPRRVAGLNISSELLPLLGLQPILGRTFTASETRPGGPAAVIISEALWDREFGRSPSALSRTIRLDDRARTVVGVLANGADFGVLQILGAAAYSRSFADRGEKTPVSVWVPLQASEDDLPRSTHPIFVIGRLADKSPISAAQQEMARITADLERAYPVNAGRGSNVEALSRVVTGPVRPALLVLVAAVALVLIVACVNVASLLLARGAARARELAIRGALGAGTSRLMRLFLVESVLLTGAAATLGLAFAYGGVRTLVALAPADVPRISEAAVSVPALAAMLVIALLIALVFAMVPAFQARRMDVQPALRAGSTRGADAPRQRRIQHVLAIAELALAVVLVCMASLLIRSFWLLRHVDPGFEPSGVIKAEYQLPASRYPIDFAKWPDFQEQHAFTREVLARARELPGVLSVAIAGNHPLDPGFTNSFTVAGREAEARSWPEISVRRVTPGYLETVGLKLLRGRLFSDADGTRSAPVALLNAAAVRRFFGDSDPIGARVRFWGTPRTVVGIVGDEKFQGLANASAIAVYTPLAQTPSANGAGVLLIRTAGDPRNFAAAARTAIRSVDPALAIFGVEPLDETVSRSISQRRFTLILMVTFAAIALLLASLGVYGVLSYGITQRRHEFGIRVAIGATPKTLMALVMREGLVLIVLGLTIGLITSLALANIARSLLFSVTPADPPTFIAVVVVLTSVAAFASLAPACRASYADPLTVLRSE